MGGRGRVRVRDRVGVRGVVRREAVDGKVLGLRGWG